MLADIPAKLRSARVGNDLQDYARVLVICSAFQNALHGGFLQSRMSDACALIFVHVARLCADVGFVCFNSARELPDKSVLHRQSNSVKHEPSGLLCDTESARKLARANAVLGINDHPSSGQPLFQSQRTIFKDRSNFDAKLFFAALAVPNPARLHEIANLLRIAARAAHTFRPTHPRQKLMASVRVAKITNRSGQRFGNLFCVHASKLHSLA